MCGIWRWSFCSARDNISYILQLCVPAKKKKHCAGPEAYLMRSATVKFKSWSALNTIGYTRCTTYLMLSAIYSHECI